MFHKQNLKMMNQKKAFEILLNYNLYNYKAKNYIIKIQLN